MSGASIRRTASLAATVLCLAACGGHTIHRAYVPNHGSDFNFKTPPCAPSPRPESRAGDVALLRARGYADDEIFDIVATAAARAFFTKTVDALGVEADIAYLEMDEGLRQSLTIGRPIAFREAERS